jgi:SPP1 gp7 family putative phage head morphogenesis protein
MTMVQPTQQPTVGNEVPPQTSHLNAVIALLAVGAGVGATSSALCSLLHWPASRSRYVEAVLTLVQIAPPNSLSPFRAAYIIAASERIAAAVEHGKTIEQAIAQERPFFTAHLKAETARVSSRVQTRQAARRYGDVLGWYARLDSHTSPECRAAHGKNFRASENTVIGLPGAVHARCRCRPGRPFKDAGWVNDAMTASIKAKEAGAA